jgi:hypothetical protein
MLFYNPVRQQTESLTNRFDTVPAQTCRIRSILEDKLHFEYPHPSVVIGRHLDSYSVDGVGGEQLLFGWLESLQVSQGDDPASALFEMLHVGLELFRVGVDPRMLNVGYAMKGHYGNLSVTCLGHRLLELLQCALRLAVEGLGHQQRVVFFRVIGLRAAGSSE